jgi:hypothetical protein
MRICEGCSRHVREVSCPFCGAASHVVVRSKSRVSRASLIGAAAVAIACSSSPPQDDAGSQDSGSDTLQAAYGGPPLDASTNDVTTNDAALDSPIAAYGGPPTDAGGG